VSSRQLAARAAKYARESIASFHAAYSGAGLRGLAGFVDLSGCDTRYADPWAFSAPDWAVTVPNSGWSAGES